MQITTHTSPATVRPNEDFVAAGPDWVMVLDGATPRPGVDSGCVHGPTWLVHQLAAAMARYLTIMTKPVLADVLASAIDYTRINHEVYGCDLANPDSPSSTVAMLRANRLDDTVDYLVLGDSPILLDLDGALVRVEDLRSAQLPSYTAEAVRAARNQEGGFWVAAAVPAAAQYAVTGTVRAGDLQRAALLTDGMTRYVDRLRLGTWSDLLNDLADGAGMADVVHRIRAAETRLLPELSTEPSGRIVKRHDDATAALCLFETRRPAGQPDLGARWG